MSEGGVDYSFECIGLEPLMEEAFNSTRTVCFNRFLPDSIRFRNISWIKPKSGLQLFFSLQGSGKTVILGMTKDRLPISLGSHDLLRGKTICGTLFGGLKPKLDIPIIVDRYLKKVYKLIYL